MKPTSDNVRPFERRQPSVLSTDDLETLRRGLTGAAAYERLRDTLTGILERRILPTMDLWEDLRETTIEVRNGEAFAPEECKVLATLLARWNQQLAYDGITEDDDSVSPDLVLALYSDVYHGTSHHQRSVDDFRQAALRR